jgi:hypothetical protein
MSHDLSVSIEIVAMFLSPIGLPVGFLFGDEWWKDGLS